MRIRKASELGKLLRAQRKEQEQGKRIWKCVCPGDIRGSNEFVLGKNLAIFFDGFYNRGCHEVLRVHSCRVRPVRLLRFCPEWYCRDKWRKRGRLCFRAQGKFHSVAIHELIRSAREEDGILQKERNDHQSIRQPWEENRIAERDFERVCFLRQEWCQNGKLQDKRQHDHTIRPTRTEDRDLQDRLKRSDYLLR